MQTPFPLGRAGVDHDPASRRFAFLPETLPILKTRTWRRYGPVLDQGRVGACTGYAMAHALNTRPNHVAREKMLTSSDALALYGLATQLDPWPGTYPEEDTGSSGLAVAKAAVQLGHIREYRWAFGFDQFLGALMEGPVLVGTIWKNDMFWPTSRGFVRPTGNEAGGHEYLAVGMDLKHRYLTFQNSWSTLWGVKGRFYMTFDDFKSLLDADGDAMLPIS